jgi:predicted ATPase
VVPWHVRLLGDVALTRGALRVTHLPSRAATALLARLALHPGRAHAREELIELLWPAVSLPVGRNRLRQVLSTLKSLLEADADAPVLLADRLSVRVAPGTLSCDATQFESAWRAGQFERARSLYQGELMPGHFDDWIGDERLRLAAIADRLPPATPPARADIAPPATGAAPSYLTRLHGRDADRSALLADLLDHRLVTLLGPGGAGKTRLAAEVASALQGAALPGAAAGRHFDVVRFVHLVTCRDRADVLHALAATLSTAPDLGALELALVGHHALLVLDNFEHLVDAAADLVQALLARLPLLHLLVTSRRVLGLDGEHERPLATLPLPAPGLDLPAAMSNPAVALFVDRAGSASPEFRLNAGNLAPVLELVQCLDGIPLALELAAARCRALSAPDMLTMLRTGPDGAPPQGLGLLARPGFRADRDQRQASMEGVVQWSWELLPAPAREMLAALTVFRADGTAAAIAAVCGLPLVEAGLQLDLLAGHSLLQVRRHADGQARYHLLEVIRQFAGARLPEARARTLRQALRRWLIDWARAEGAMPLPARIEPELPNVHAAVWQAAADDACAEAMQLALAMRDYWELDGMPERSQQALEDALARAGAGWDAGLRSDAHELLAYTSMNSGLADTARAHAEAAVALAGSDARRRGRGLLRRAWVGLATDYQAGDVLGPLDEALALARGTGDTALQARVLHQQGIAARYQRRDLAAAESLFAQAQALWESLGNRRLAMARMRNRAQCWAAQGLHAAALERFRECEAAALADGDWTGIVDSTLGAATALTRLRRWDEALAVQRRCVSVAWQRHHAHGLAYALWNIAQPLMRLGQGPIAVRMMAFAQAYWTGHFAPLSASDEREVARLLRLARVRLDRPRIEALWREGSAMGVSDAVALALGPAEEG